jgi:hypothetical protein
MTSLLRSPFAAGALALVIAGLGALPAQASPSVLRGLLNTQPAVMSRGGQTGTREARVAVDQPLGPAPAMSSFRLDFGSSDHRIQRMMIMPDTTAFRAALSDQNGDDRFRAMGAWWVIPGATGGTVSGLVRGIGEFEVPPGPPNTTLVLSGFDFRRTDGTDANVRTLAIQLDGESRRIRTVLLDDQGTDFTSFAEAVAVGFAFSIIGGPAGAIAGSGGMATLNQGPVNANSRLRAYNVEIAYAWVPNLYVDTMREVSGDNRRRVSISGVLPSHEQYALTGFSFHFGNSDHFIGRMGVHMGDEGSVISWQDSNLDDPVQWTVRYVPVRPNPSSNFLRPRG